MDELGNGQPQGERLVEAMKRLTGREPVLIDEKKGDNDGRVWIRVYASADLPKDTALAFIAGAQRNDLPPEVRGMWVAPVVELFEAAAAEAGWEIYSLLGHLVGVERFLK